MDNVIEIHRKLLLDVAEACRSLPAQIGAFGANTLALPQVMVKLRLTQIQTAVILGERHLQLQHGGKGFIFAQAGHGILTIRWAELDLLEGRDASTGSSGSAFLSLKVVLDKIKELVSQVDRGEVVAAVEWLRRYSEINIDGLNQLGWHLSHERKDAEANVIIEKNIRQVPVHGESPVYVVSLMGRRLEGTGNVHPSFRGFSRFLILTVGNLRRLLTKSLIGVKSMWPRVYNRVKY